MSAGELGAFERLKEAQKHSRRRMNPNHKYGLWPVGKCYRCGEDLGIPRKPFPDFCDSCVKEIYIEEGYRNAILYYGGPDLITQDGTVVRTSEEYHHLTAFEFTPAPRLERLKEETYGRY